MWKLRVSSQHFLQTSLVKKRNEILEQKALRIVRHKIEKGLKVLGAGTFFEVRS